MNDDDETSPEAFEAAGKPEIAALIREGLAEGRVRYGGGVVMVGLLRPFTAAELRGALNERNQNQLRHKRRSRPDAQ